MERCLMTSKEVGRKVSSGPQIDLVDDSLHIEYRRPVFVISHTIG